MATTILNLIANHQRTAHQLVGQNHKPVALLLCILVLTPSTSATAEGFRGGVREALGPSFDTALSAAATSIHPQRSGSGSLSRLRYWNQIALNCSGLDHTPVATGENRVFGEQLGTGRASRAMAIIHIAMFEAVNAIAGGYRSYTGLSPAVGFTSIDAAIAQAAHDTLVALFPSQQLTLNQLLA